MHYPSSKLTSKYQATVPEPVRKRLQLQAGDRIAFEITDTGQICLHKVIPEGEVDPSQAAGMMEEWESTADEDAYGAL